MSNGKTGRRAQSRVLDEPRTDGRTGSRRFRLILTFAVAAMILALLPATAGAKQSDDGTVDFWLTVLHNNDGESDLLADEVLDDEGNVIGFEKGVAYFANTLRDARTAANKKDKGDSAKRGTIFVSSGDNFLASPSFTASLADGVYYDAIALDSLRYDAITLGNHDFDFGPDVLADFISEGFSRPGHPPYVSANIDVSGEPTLQALADDGIITGSTIVKERGVRIGIVGAVTPALPTISSPRDVVVNEVAPAVQAEVDDLDAAGVDIIVIISHLQDINGDIALAGLLDGIDVMVAGGGDELLANPDDLLLPGDDADDVFGAYPLYALGADGANIPVVTTSGQYGYLGHLTVGFDDGEVVTVDDSRSGPIRVVSEHFSDGVRPNGALNARVVRPVEEFVSELAANVIATSEVDLDGRRSSVRAVESNEGNLLADALRWQATKLAADFGVAPPEVAMQNGGGIRNDDIIPAGDFTELDTFDIAPFPNFVSIVAPITRMQFKELLENAVSRIPPAAAPGGSGRFSQVSGFSFTYDTTGTPLLYNEDGTVAIAGTRVVDVVLDNGTMIVSDGAVVPGPGISVATNDFSARGGDQWFAFGATFTSIGVSYQQALSNYIQAADGLNGVISSDDYPEGGEDRIIQLP